MSRRPWIAVAMRASSLGLKGRSARPLAWGMNLLILGGTTEASGLARVLAGRSGLAPLLSLAGRTRAPVLPPIPIRVGGFGGVAGLADYLGDNHVAAVIDATHPFAARISANAVEACRSTGVPLAVYTRPPWIAQPGDRWKAVPDIAAAVAQLGPGARRVFLTTGRLDVAAFRAAPQHHFVIRAIEAPDPADLPPHHRLVLARPPFTVADEAQLMRVERIDILVTKNSGGAASAAKLAAARQCGIPVIIVERPPVPARLELTDLAAVLAWIAAQRGRP